MKDRKRIRQILFITLLAGCVFSRQIPLVAQASEPENDYAQEVFTLLANAQYTDAIVLQQDVEEYVEKAVWVKGTEGRKKVLDLNGYTMMCPRIENYANLYLIDSAGGGALILTDGALTNCATLTIDGADVVCTTVNASPIQNRRGMCFRLVSGSVMAEGRCAIMNGGGTCIIDGGSICGRSIAINSYPGYELYPVYTQDENGEIIGSTGTRFHDATLVINGGKISGNIEICSTNVTITGGTIRGSIKGEKANGDEIENIEYHNASGELIALPLPTYELHEENGKMKRGYWDVPIDAWFYAPVQTLMDTETLGYGKDGNFGPTESLTRVQAAALLVRSCGLSVEVGEGGSPFEDVTVATPYADYIAAGYDAGLFAGNGQGQFRPDGSVTRQEFAVLVMNAVRQGLLDMPAQSGAVSFSDVADIAPWAKKGVLDGAAHGLWQGFGGAFMPQRPVSRAEAVTVLERAWGLSHVHSGE